MYRAHFTDGLSDGLFVPIELQGVHPEMAEPDQPPL